MAGLNLSRYGNGFAGSGVTAALPPSYAASSAGATISARAYGVGSAGDNCGPRTAAYGATGIGLLGIATLVYLWWSLPR
jgi:hypothetical protein